MEAPTLTTVRLVLRAHRLEDADAHEALWTEPSVVRFTSGEPLSREVAWTRFLRKAGAWHYLGFGYFALEERASGRYLGEAGFQDVRRDLTPSIEGTLEAGWVLGPEAQGRGLAEEAMRAALEWADRAHAGRRITAIVRPEHAASRHVAGKLGFVEVASTLYHDRPTLVLERHANCGEQTLCDSKAR